MQKISSQWAAGGDEQSGIKHTWTAFLVRRSPHKKTVLCVAPLCPEKVLSVKRMIIFLNDRKRLYTLITLKNTEKKP